MDNESLLQLVNRLSEEPFPVTEAVDAAIRLQREGNAAAAAMVYRLWSKIHADDPLRYVALFNLGTMLSSQGDLAGAKDALEAAIASKPDFHPAYINYGGVLEKLGNADEAVRQWTEIVKQLSPVVPSAVTYKVTALKQIGRLLEENRRHASAEAHLHDALSLDPDQAEIVQHFVMARMVQCKWPVVDPWEEVSRLQLMKGFEPLTVAAYADDPVFHMGVAWNYNRTYDPPPGTAPLWRSAARPPSKRLRVGYLSSDLRAHAIGFLMAELFELHDRKRFEVTAYYCGIPEDDAIKTRIRGAVEHWVDVSALDDDAAARKIADDNIDILIDVNGYTRSARGHLLSLRPAPVIVNWLGFPGTMGSPHHNYLLADPWIVPEGDEIYYTEKVLRLPCYQPNDRKRAIAPHRPTRAEVGLPENAVVYCSFNGSHKFTRFTFDRWMQILQEVPGSVLWLLGVSEPVDQGIAQQAQARGIDPARIVFAPKIANPFHLARYPLADLFLDSAPYGAHTTASDAMWMGVPVLTFAGRSFAARVCASLVRAAGMPDLVCDGPDEFVARAIALGRDPAALRGYRDRLEANRKTCTLFDMDAHVRGLEGLLREMWGDFEAGRLPQPDLRNLDVYRDLALADDYEGIERIRIEDLAGHYRALLAARDRVRPVPEDARLWTPKARTAARESA